VVDTWTMQSYRRSRKRGRAAVRSDDLEHWHDLRKSLKKLRYLITSFEYLHEPKEVKAVRKPLKALQEHIGGLQDCRVQDDLLAEMRDRATAAHLHGAAELASAMSAAVGARLARVHAECTEAWLEFDTPATEERFEALTAHRD
jgi:CHAD domain-containing protein